MVWKRCRQYWLSICLTWEDVCGTKFLALLERSLWLSWWSHCLLSGLLLYEDIAGGKKWFVYHRHFRPSHTPRWFASTPPIKMVMEQLAHNQSEYPMASNPPTATTLRLCKLNPALGPSACAPPRALGFRLWWQGFWLDTIKYSVLLVRDCGTFWAVILNYWFVIEVIVCDHVVTDWNVPLRLFHPKYKSTVTSPVGSHLALWRSPFWFSGAKIDHMEMAGITLLDLTETQRTVVVRTCGGDHELIRKPFTGVINEVRSRIVFS